MAAKVQWMKDAWWVTTHAEGRRWRRRVGTTKAHRRAAEEMARKINAGLALGTFGLHEKREAPLLCKDELERWLLAYAPTLKPSYRVSAQQVIRSHLVPFFGSLDVREIRQEHLLQYVRTKLSAVRPAAKGGSEPRAPLKPATIRVHLAVLRRVLTLLERDGKITTNPARGIGELLRQVGRASALETEEVEYWTRREVKALLALAREHEPRFAPLLALLFATGLRRGEALGLQPRWTPKTGHAWTPENRP